MSVVDAARMAIDLAKRGMTIELQEQLRQLRKEALELEEENLCLKKENRKLKERIELQETVKFRRRMYWREGDEVPFCPYCYEKSHLLIHLSGPQQRQGGRLLACPECRTEYWTSGEKDFIIYSPSGVK
jgi:hypothetical protein